MREKEIRRRKMDAAARMRRKKKRKKIVIIEWISLAVVISALAAGSIILFMNFMPGIRVARELKAVNNYITNMEYEQAIAACEEALKIDSMSVQAYKTMAGVYLNQNDRISAEEILYKGWKTTQDESLLQEYCVYMLNDAVADINEEDCTLATLEKCVTALEEVPSNYEQDACCVF